MSELSIDEKIQRASKWILQAPAGQVNDVVADIRVIVADDAALEEGLRPALQAYNLEQFITAQLPNEAHPIILCKSAQLEGGRYLDPRSKQSFAFDHVQMTASEIEPVRVWETQEAIRQSIESALTEYTENHYSLGVSATFSDCPPVPSSSTTNLTEEPTDTKNASEVTASEEPTSESETIAEAPASEEVATEEDAKAETVEEDAPTENENEQEPTEAVTATVTEEELEEPKEKKYAIYITGNRYNTGNFWTGRWRSFYEFDADTGALTGLISVHVHYYEQGNVQLATSFPVSTTVKTTSDPTTLAKELVKVIGNIEKDYQVSLNEAYGELSDKTFKQLRRTLPIHKQKLDWNRITSYRLRGELKRDN